MSDFTPDDHIHAFFDSWNALRRLLSRIDPLNPNVDIGEVEFHEFKEILALVEMHAGAAKETLRSFVDGDSNAADAARVEGQTFLRFAKCEVDELKLLSELLFQRLLFDQMNLETPKAGPALWRLTQDISVALEAKKTS